MTEYLVTWEIDAETGNPREAAQQARDAQLRPGTWAVVFHVINKENGEVTCIDLLDADGDSDRVIVPAQPATTFVPVSLCLFTWMPCSGNG